MLSRATSFGLEGLSGYRMQIEVDFSSGMPQFEIVGLPDAAVKESRERVRAAIINSGFPFPLGRITVNLAPADKRKIGPRYDLPIALALLAADGRLPASALEGVLVMGELSLDGGVRSIPGSLSLLIAARQAGLLQALVPTENAQAGGCLEGMTLYPVDNLRQAVAHLLGEAALPAVPYQPYAAGTAHFTQELSNIRGQQTAKRALEIAAAGAHNLLLLGPPGAGKTMLARCLPALLPPMTFQEALETTLIHSAAGLTDQWMTTRPFRTPHHSASPASLTGGGRLARPGEMSLAHNGVLFLDELPEFPRQALEALRQPMEDGVVSVSRVGAHCTYPAAFALVAAMNPCPCGNHGSRVRPCRCTPGAIARYLNRISGPLLDRIDMVVEMDAVPVDEMFAQDGRAADKGEAVRARVQAARRIQQDRLRTSGIHANARMSAGQVESYAGLDAPARAFMRDAVQRLGLSVRASVRARKVARTLADLQGLPTVGVEQLAEALQYRGAAGFWEREGEA